MWRAFVDGVQTHTRAKKPDGYVKMLFLPTGFIQDPVFARKWLFLCVVFKVKRKIYWMLLFTIPFAFVMLSLCYSQLVYGKVTNYIYSNSYFCIKNLLASETLICLLRKSWLRPFKTSISHFPYLKKKKGNVTFSKAISKHPQKKNRTAAPDCWPPHAGLTFLGSE